MVLPSDLLRHISAEGGGHVVLVTGAGCSMEAPTNLRSGGDYSEAAYTRLLHDGVLPPNSCKTPRDLSAVAERVYEVTGSQRELTQRLPRTSWRLATPNAGHKAAAAMLIEGSLRAIVTLNYDLAMQTALSLLGAGSSVAVVRGPEDHSQMGSKSLVFLHRSVDSPDEDWVLRQSVLEEDWRDSWEEMVAAGALSAPVTVFVGLGSPAAVLTESVSRLSKTAGMSYYLVDRFPESAFAAALDGALTETIEMGWSDLAESLGERVAQEQLIRFQAAAETLADEQGWEKADILPVTEAMRELGLVELGRMRAAWLANDCDYAAESEGLEQACLGDLALAVGRAAVELDAELWLASDGRVRLVAEGHPDLSFLCAHGGGVRSWTSIELRVRRLLGAMSVSEIPRVVLVSGVTDRPESPPADLVPEDDREDLVRGGNTLAGVFPILLTRV